MIVIIILGQSKDGVPHNYVTWIRINTLRPRQMAESFQTKLKCMNFDPDVPKGPINDIPASFQMMAWRRPGDKTLSETIMVSLLTHICATRTQLVKCSRFILLDTNDVVICICPLQNIFPTIYVKFHQLIPSSTIAMAMTKCLSGLISHQSLHHHIFTDSLCGAFCEL